MNIDHQNHKGIIKTKHQTLVDIKMDKYKYNKQI